MRNQCFNKPCGKQRNCMYPTAKTRQHPILFLKAIKFRFVELFAGSAHALASPFGRGARRAERVKCTLVTRMYFRQMYKPSSLFVGNGLVPFRCMHHRHPYAISINVQMIKFVRRERSCAVPLYAPSSLVRISIYRTDRRIGRGQGFSLRRSCRVATDVV